MKAREEQTRLKIDAAGARKGQRRSKDNNEKRSATGAFLIRERLDLPALKHLGISEQLEEPGIDLAIFDGETQNLQGAVEADGFFVGAVHRRQRVGNIGDGHDAGLRRNLRGPE